MKRQCVHCGSKEIMWWIGKYFDYDNLPHELVDGSLIELYSYALCKECLFKYNIGHYPSGDISCKTCDRRFVKWGWGDPNQGHFCATSRGYNNNFYSGYGSIYDGNMYVSTKTFDLKCDENICDHCIENFVANGTFIDNN